MLVPSSRLGMRYMRDKRAYPVIDQLSRTNKPRECCLTLHVTSRILRAAWVLNARTTTAPVTASAIAMSCILAPEGQVLNIIVKDDSIADSDN